MSDDYHELGAGYTYVGEGGDMNHISGGHASGNTDIRGKVTRFDYDESFIIAEQEPSYQEYKSAVSWELNFRYSMYYRYLTDSVSWKPEWSAAELDDVRKFEPLYTVLKHRGVKVDSLGNSVDDSQSGAVADSLLQNSPYYRNIFSRKRNYWIIDKRTDKGFGPFDSTQFSQQCKQLGVNLKLEAHNVAPD